MMVVVVTVVSIHRLQQVLIKTSLGLFHHLPHPLLALQSQFFMVLIGRRPHFNFLSDAAAYGGFE